MDKNKNTERTCAGCLFRNPATGYCPRRGYEVEADREACACWAEPLTYFGKLKLNNKTKRSNIMQENNTASAVAETPAEEKKEIKANDGYAENDNLKKPGKPARRGRKKADKPEKQAAPAQAEPKAEGKLRGRKPSDAVRKALAGIKDTELVEEIRLRGWDVKYQRTVVETL